MIKTLIYFLNLLLKLVKGIIQHNNFFTKRATKSLYMTNYIMMKDYMTNYIMMKDLIHSVVLYLLFLTNLMKTESVFVSRYRKT